MRSISYIMIVILAICGGSACSQHNSNYSSHQEGVSEASIYEDFKYPERYAEIVEQAESDDEKSIIMLARYYANFPKTDLRNLEYWSIKASKINGREEFTNLIVSLVSHGKCNDAWRYLDENYADRKEFPFYSLNELQEAIDKNCERKI